MNLKIEMHHPNAQPYRFNLLNLDTVQIEKYSQQKYESEF